MKIPLQIVLNITLDLETGKFNVDADPFGGVPNVVIGANVPAPSAPAPAPKADVQVQAATAEAVIKDEPLRAAFVAAVNRSSKAAALEVLAATGYAKVVDIPNDHRAKFLADLKALPEVEIPF